MNIIIKRAQRLLLSHTPRQTFYKLYNTTPLAPPLHKNQSSNDFSINKIITNSIYQSCLLKQRNPFVSSPEASVLFRIADSLLVNPQSLSFENGDTQLFQIIMNFQKELLSLPNLSPSTAIQFFNIVSDFLVNKIDGLSLRKNILESQLRFASQIRPVLDAIEAKIQDPKQSQQELFRLIAFLPYLSLQTQNTLVTRLEPYFSDMSSTVFFRFLQALIQSKVRLSHKAAGNLILNNKFNPANMPMYQYYLMARIIDQYQLLATTNLVEVHRNFYSINKIKKEQVRNDEWEEMIYMASYFHRVTSKQGSSDRRKNHLVKMNMILCQIVESYLSFKPSNLRMNPEYLAQSILQLEEVMNYNEFLYEQVTQTFLSILPYFKNIHQLSNAITESPKKVEESPELYKTIFMNLVKRTTTRYDYLGIQNNWEELDESGPHTKRLLLICIQSLKKFYPTLIFELEDLNLSKTLKMGLNHIKSLVQEAMEALRIDTLDSQTLRKIMCFLKNNRSNKVMEKEWMLRLLDKFYDLPYNNKNSIEIVLRASEIIGLTPELITYIKNHVVPELTRTQTLMSLLPQLKHLLPLLSHVKAYSAQQFREIMRQEQLVSVIKKIPLSFKLMRAEDIIDHFQSYQALRGEIEIPEFYERVLPLLSTFIISCLKDNKLTFHVMEFAIRQREVVLALIRTILDIKISVEKKHQTMCLQLLATYFSKQLTSRHFINLCDIIGYNKDYYHTQLIETLQNLTFKNSEIHDALCSLSFVDNPELKKYWELIEMDSSIHIHENQKSAIRLHQSTVPPRNPDNDLYECWLKNVFHSTESPKKFKYREPQTRNQKIFRMLFNIFEDLEPQIKVVREGVYELAPNAEINYNKHKTLLYDLYGIDFTHEYGQYYFKTEIPPQTQPPTFKVQVVKTSEVLPNQVGSPLLTIKPFRYEQLLQCILFSNSEIMEYFVNYHIEDSKRVAKNLASSMEDSQDSNQAKVYGPLLLMPDKGQGKLVMESQGNISYHKELVLGIYALQLIGYNVRGFTKVSASQAKGKSTIKSKKESSVDK